MRELEKHAKIMEYENVSNVSIGADIGNASEHIADERESRKVQKRKRQFEKKRMRTAGSLSFFHLLENLLNTMKMLRFLIINLFFFHDLTLKNRKAAIFF